MVNNLLTSSQRQQVLKVWSREQLKLGTAYNQKVQVYKQLSWLWADEEIIKSFNPTYGGYYWDQTNTVLIDDSLDKAAAEPYNLLQVGEYSISEDALKVDMLRQVALYLEELSVVDNVSSHLRVNPFRPSLNVNAEAALKFTWAELDVLEG